MGKLGICRSRKVAMSKNALVKLAHEWDGITTKYQFDKYCKEHPDCNYRKVRGTYIYELGGVTVTKWDADSVYADVDPSVIDGANNIPKWVKPSTGGRIYHPFLAKTGWENVDNVGGWIQGWDCECKWAFNHNQIDAHGEWGNVMCAHAYATKLATDSRARQELLDRHGKFLRELSRQAERENAYMKLYGNRR